MIALANSSNVSSLMAADDIVSICSAMRMSEEEPSSVDLSTAASFDCWGGLETQRVLRACSWECAVYTA